MPDPLIHGGRRLARNEGTIAFYMKLNSLEALLHHELKDLYSTENQLVTALPKMAQAAANADLGASSSPRRAARVRAVAVHLWPNEEAAAAA